MNEIFIFNIAKLAVKSIINIASVYPKPGLITPLDNSALDGTSYPVLIDGTMSLFQCFVNFASTGADTEKLKPEDAFTILKAPGKIGSQDVLRATKGKLSMKGHILCLGLLSAAAGRLISQNRILTPAALALTASSFAQDLTKRELWALQDREDKKILTSGEKAYISYGIEGCRGEAEHGYNMTLKAVEIMRQLNAMHGQLTLREKCTHAIINIMSEIQDSNLAAHGGITELMRIQEKAADIIKIGGMLTAEGIDAIFELDKDLRSKGLAPSGSAVVLAGALFIGELLNLKLTRSGYDE